ncbi:hypothetical protein T440DRAFT_484562 [Plenodomus tracheiphilus IPT5]|uniref:Uncharacterized protein n=1 Tax=Plenodomus tracheiphilus IPT5 TaxID=1408161 RepID=A0A6A7ALG6_9PLEO|nr:hypothetical protein T440DRAFT_484562 [Plenodomus tracheiphilus IPT5]
MRSRTVFGIGSSSITLYAISCSGNQRMALALLLIHVNVDVKQFLEEGLLNRSMCFVVVLPSTGQFEQRPRLISEGFWEVLPVALRAQSSLNLIRISHQFVGVHMLRSLASL